MKDNKARMLGLIYLIFMTVAAVVYGFDIPEKPVIRIGSGAVQDARFSPDGKYLAVATSLGVEIRDANTLEQLRFLPGASEPVVFNHQTTLFVTGTGTIWDTADFTKIAELPEEQSVFAFTPDDSLLITGHWETAVSAWDTGNWQKVRTYSSKYDKADVHGLSISSDGKLLCASFIHPNLPGQPFWPFSMGTIIIWEVQSGREIKILVDEVIYPDTVAFSPDGAILATNIRSDTLLWDTQTWEEAGRFGRSGGGGACYGCVYSMEFQPGTRLLACPNGYSVELWDTDVVAKVRGLSGHADLIASVSFHPDGNLLATVSLDGDMKLWDVTSGEEIEMTPYSSPVAALTFSQDSETLIYCGEKRKTERYNLVTGEIESIIPAEVGSYKAIDFGANGSLLAVTNSGQITIYNTDTGEVELSLGGRYNDATFSYDGNTLVILARPDPGTYAAMLWDARTRKVIAEIPLTGFPSKVVLGDEDRMLAVITGVPQGDEIQIWDVATRRKESAFPNNGGGYPVNMALSNTGKLLAADGTVFEPDRGGRSVVKVWDVDKGEVLYILEEAKGTPTALAFSPDDKILVTGGSRGEMALWDMVDGTMLQLYHEHASKVNCLEFSSDGRYLASGGEDGLILIWEVNVGGSSGVVDTKMEDTALVRWGAVKRTALLQNYPNPFNPETWIPFSLSEPKHVIIRIYTLNGQLIRMLDLGQKPSGEYLSKEKAAYWNGRNEKGELVASDVYFYVMEAGESSTFLRKMVMAR
jgi:WD40 repeat protein